MRFILPAALLLASAASAQVFVGREVQVYIAPSESSAITGGVPVSREVNAYAPPSEAESAAATPVSREVNAQVPNLLQPTIATNATGREVPAYAGPRDTVYVSIETGDDDALGTQQDPLQGLDTAVAYASTYAEPDRPITVQAGSGVYNDVVSVPSNVRLFGANPLDPSETILEPSAEKLGESDGAIVRVEDGATGAAIRDLTLRAGEGAKGAGPITLLMLDNAEAAVDNVVFDGGNIGGTTGVAAFDPGSDGSEIAHSIFQDIDTGVAATDSALNISRNIFDGINGDAVTVTPGARKGITNTPLLGDELSPENTGYNTFENVSGNFVNNQTGETVFAEMNDWGVYEEAAIGLGMIGSVSFVPFLGQNYFAASIFVSLFDSQSQVPVYNATVALSPAAGQSTSTNIDGVYPFASIAPSNYTVTAQAPGYNPAEQAVAVDGSNPAVEVALPLQRNNDQPAAPAKHQADIDGDGRIGLTEVIRGIQFYNAARIRCLTGTEDGFAIGDGSKSCPHHAADYNPTDWSIGLSELLRLIQFYSMGAYERCPNGEDGYCITSR